MFTPARVYLTGMPGVGKTTSGIRLSQRLDWPFIDLDQVWEARFGQSIASFFSQKGEEAFRQTETEVLQVVETQPAIIATGGGLPLRAVNRDWMKAQGLVVWLDYPLAQISRQLSAQDLSQRPLLAPFAENLEALLSHLQALYQKRSPAYADCHLRVHSEADLFAELLALGFPLS